MELGTDISALYLDRSVKRPFFMGLKLETNKHLTNNLV